jgi:hypothetical protein
MKRGQKRRIMETNVRGGYKESKRSKGNDQMMRIKMAHNKRRTGITIWGALRALALGTALGAGVGIPCSRWAGVSPLLCTAVQSAASGMMLGFLVSGAPEDLATDTSFLPADAGG